MPNRKIELSIMDNDLTTLTDEELDAVAAGQRGAASVEGKATAKGLELAEVRVVGGANTTSDRTGATSEGFLVLSSISDSAPPAKK
jgi:hypothetical protein